MKFMGKLGIPDKVLLQWITQKSASTVYHKCSDLLLQYVTDTWAVQRDVPEKMEGVVEGSSLVQPEQIIQEENKVQDEEEPHYSCVGEFLIAQIQHH